jgi:hypothetical protein
MVPWRVRLRYTAGMERRGGMQLKTMDNESQMDGLAIRQDGDNLLIEGRIMGALPIRAVLTPDQARAALKLLNFRTVLFLLTLLFRRGRQRRGGDHSGRPDAA